MAGNEPEIRSLCSRRGLPVARSVRSGKGRQSTRFTKRRDLSALFEAMPVWLSKGGQGPDLMKVASANLHSKDVLMLFESRDSEDAERIDQRKLRAVCVRWIEQGDLRGFGDAYTKALLEIR